MLNYLKSHYPAVTVINILVCFLPVFFCYKYIYTGNVFGNIYWMLLVASRGYNLWMSFCDKSFCYQNISPVLRMMGTNTQIWQVVDMAP